MTITQVINIGIVVAIGAFIYHRLSKDGLTDGRSKSPFLVLGLLAISLGTIMGLSYANSLFDILLLNKAGMGVYFVCYGYAQVAVYFLWKFKSRKK